MVQEEEDPLAAPLLSHYDNETPGLLLGVAQEEEEVWDVVFDKEEPIGLQTCNNNDSAIHSNSTQISAVQAGSQAESLGIAQQLMRRHHHHNHGGIYIIAVGGKPVYNIKEIWAQVRKCRRDSTAHALVFTLSRQPIVPPPVCKLCWICTKQVVRCVPKPNRQILTRNHKFLGLVGPAQHVQRCCCPWFGTKNMKIRLETTVCLLAWFLLLKAVIVFISLAFVICGDAAILAMTNVNYIMAQAIVEGGLALYVLSGMVTRRSWALLRFALMLFVVTVTSVTASLAQLIGIVAEDPSFFSEDWPWLVQWLVMLALDTAQKLYTMWTAWSLAKEYKKDKRDDDDENRNHETGHYDYVEQSQQQGQEEIPDRHDEASGTTTVSAPDISTEEDDEGSNDEEAASFSLT